MRDVAGCVVLGLIVLFGMWMRLDQIAIQIIADDEWHALNYLAAQTYDEVFRHFAISDHCIPLTLFYKAVSDTVGLSELAMRAPPLLAGIAALVLLPLFLRERLGWTTSLLFAALLAISPLHVYFSRYARPYSIVFLLGFGGVLAFERWLATGVKRWGWIYAACAILGPWFQPVALPFLLAPIPFALLRGLVVGDGFVATVKKLLPFGLAIACGLALLLGPPISTDFATIRERSGKGYFDAETVRIGFHMISGSTLSGTLALFAAMLAFGLLVWTGRRRGSIAYFAFLLACQGTAVAISRPEGVHASIVALRYMLPGLGVALLLAAEGLARVDELLHEDSRGLVPRYLGATLAVVALVAFGPLLSLSSEENRVYFRPNAWTNHMLYQYQYAEQDRHNMAGTVVPPRIPNFYVHLAQSARSPEAADERILEAPWCLEWAISPFATYQRAHERPMTIGFVNEPGASSWSEFPWPDPRFRFEHFVNLADFDRLRSLGVRYVVLHKNLPAEMPHDRAPLERTIEPSFQRLTERFGPPFWDDDDMYVFDARPAR